MSQMCNTLMFSCVVHLEGRDWEVGRKGKSVKWLPTTFFKFERYKFLVFLTDNMRLCVSDNVPAAGPGLNIF